MRETSSKNSLAAAHTDAAADADADADGRQLSNERSGAELLQGRNHRDGCSRSAFEFFFSSI